MANLKLAYSATHKVQKERLICGEIHRHSLKAEDHNKRHTRKYSTIDNCIVGMTRWMYLYGCVGDVCVIYHTVTGLEIGTMKMSAKGKLITDFIYDR